MVSPDSGTITKPTEPVARSKLVYFALNRKAKSLPGESRFSLERLLVRTIDSHIRRVGIPRRPRRGIDKIPPDYARGRFDPNLVVHESIRFLWIESLGPMNLAVGLTQVLYWAF